MIHLCIGQFDLFLEECRVHRGRDSGLRELALGVQNPLWTESLDIQYTLDPVTKRALDSLAWLLSVLLSPFIAVPYFCTLLAQSVARSSQEFYHLAALCTALSIGVPALYIAWYVWQGQITDLHVRQLSQRKGPFRAGKWSMGALFVSLWGYGAPIRLTHLAGILFAQVFVFEAISKHWKISMHTGVLAACLAAMIEIDQWNPACLLILLPLAWARQRRGRHLWSQAFGGAALGYALTAYPLAWLATF